MVTKKEKTQVIIAGCFCVIGLVILWFSIIGLHDAKHSRDEALKQLKILMSDGR